MRDGSELIKLGVKRHVGLRVQTNLAELAAEIHTTPHLPHSRAHRSENDHDAHNVQHHRIGRHRPTHALAAILALVSRVAETAALLYAVIVHADSVAAADRSVAVRMAFSHRNIPSLPTLRASVDRVQPDHV